MDKGNSNSRLFTQLYSALLMWVVLISYVPAASAQQAIEGCEIALNKETYSEYLLTADIARVERIQRELNQLVAAKLATFDEVVVDGVLGGATRQALYHYCQGLKMAPADNFVNNLITRLDQQVALMAAVENTINENEQPSSPPAPIVKVTSTTEGAIGPADKAEVKAKEEPGDQPSIWYLLTKEGLSSALEASQPPAPPVVQTQDADKEKGEIGGEGKEEAEPGGGLSITVPDEEALARLESVLDIPYVNRSQFLHAVAAESGIDAAVFPEFSEKLVAAATNVASSRLKPVIVDDDSCGCVRDFSDTVYGFYPYWRSTLSREDEPTEDGVEDDLMPVIDYSVFKRIAYYALTLNESGEITTPLHWNSNGKLGNFINKARRHKTEVDLVVYSDHWPQWTKSTLQASVTSVYNQLMLQIEYKQSGVMAYVPFLSSTIASPNGITLHLDGYSDHPESRYKIFEFISQLYERLEDLERKYKINILLDIGADDMTSTSKLFADIKSLLVKDKNGAPAYIDSLLVFIDEPTTETKKLLRSKIEDEFSGAKRMEVLRKVIPVISPYGHENDARGPYTQFDDDLIYLKNNFSGVALWPMPLASDKDASTVSQRLIEIYGAGEVEGVINSLSARYPAICEFACPNRWAFRVAIDLLLVLAVGYGVLAIFSRRLRRFYSRNSVYFISYILLMVVVFSISLMCDPFWKQMRDKVFVGSFLIVAAFFMIRKYIRAKQGPLP